MSRNHRKDPGERRSATLAMEIIASQPRRRSRSDAVFRGLKKARIVAVAAWPAMPRFTERISFLILFR